MPKRSSKSPDPNKRAYQVVQEATEDADAESQAAPEPEQPVEKNPAAVALGRLGGKKGGKARAEKLSKARRSEIAKKAATDRWSRRTKPE